ncbi:MULTISPECIES: isocitrate lyase/phosphoenolpyruvate mutase family protein [unclassified Lysobacter]|uniref:isocitrate lyase/PEP mutase family protein n=1 Tax=unclassified Lysobacter TaxID=2635362 RepID=UPI001C22C550|nr:isocitrate lyase/phosphoenolpyruvate mutase family protein [Lysobacter sp. MMG2]MBU8977999.1 isocitrate lyase/phosphoenolpyruvate mutase family protein [Lysobacter sp. MMG2]
MHAQHNAEHATRFRSLHAQGVLRLANAWDAGSARLIESLGAPAIATTSAGVAWSRGHADGDELPIELLLATVADIARVIRVPLSVDMESGYSDDPATVAANVLRVAEAGAVGINLEDGAAAPDLLCAKIARIRQTLAERGLDVYINARTDVYLRGLAPPEQRVQAVLERAGRYREAGADGLFVPGLTEAGDIADIARGAGLPLNVMLRPQLPALPELETLGVRRLSAGSHLAEAVFAQVGKLAGAFLQDGRAAPAECMDYGDINALFAAR